MKARGLKVVSAAGLKGGMRDWLGCNPISEFRAVDSARVLSCTSRRLSWDLISPNRLGKRSASPGSAGRESFSRVAMQVALETGKES